ncbi:hypothetical protein BIW11_09586 [Tropilaelaps mercedesae]|uniref:SOWAHA-C winged helix-turn-helix domain-containing protein n=1 Tax=Tropilaelaps mercedesae TaxID=418985 RepID=A0A1V9XJS0_9ACAR|nr:hypothetical protein BIW11_09586 [Tropilaelaps mercedesae]
MEDSVKDGNVPMMFTKDDILSELLASDGRMLNSQLVLRFARYLKNPATKEEAKAKFKDYVNKLATLVTDPQSGDKFVVLRAEVREQRRRQPAQPPVGSVQGLPRSSNYPASLSHSTGQQTKGTYSGVVTMVGAQSVMPQQLPRPVSHGHPQILPQQQQFPSLTHPHSKVPPAPPPGRPARQPPAYQHAVSSSKRSRAPVAVGAGAQLPVAPHASNQSIALTSAAPMLPSPMLLSHHSLRGRPLSLKLVHSGHTPQGTHRCGELVGSASVVDGLTASTPALTPPLSSLNVPPNVMGHHQRRSSAGMINTQLLQQSGMVIPKGSPVGSMPPPFSLRCLSKSFPNLLADGMHMSETIDTDCPPVVPSRSRRHSIKGTVVEEKVKQFAEKEFTKVGVSEKPYIAYVL